MKCSKSRCHEAQQKQVPLIAAKADAMKRSESSGQHTLWKPDVKAGGHADHDRIMLTLRLGGPSRLLQVPARSICTYNDA
eukprot:595124-Pelagomonas_calceolata.AAC.4